MKALVIGGNRFFGRHLVEKLLADGTQVSILNRGRIRSPFSGEVLRITADRKDEAALESATKNQTWDVVYDQIAYSAKDARDACRIFAGKVGRYVVTSSESIYDAGTELPESAFDAENFVFTADADPLADYQAAKRQVEAEFSRNAEFPLAIARPSLVVGVDDYTRRLHWHLDRIRAGQTLYFPNLEIYSDFVRSDQAATALKLIGESSVIGPVNLTTRGSWRLGDFLKMCEAVAGKSAILSSEPNDLNHSPYGGEASKTMDVDLLYSLGFAAPSSTTWLGEVIEDCAAGQALR